MKAAETGDEGAARRQFGNVTWFSSAGDTPPDQLDILGL
jgi:hypothetical protein